MGALANFSALNASRARLAENGVFYQLIYNADSMANLSGGIKAGVNYSGRLESAFDIYLGRLIGKDATHGLFANDKVHIDIFTIQGAGITGDYVGSLASISGIEAAPNVRLFEAWWEHAAGPWSLRAGQMGIDSEFFGSGVATQFSNNTFSWPVVMSADLPDGGAASTLSTLAARLKFVDPAQAFEWQAAIFNGDPTQPGPGPAQRRNPYGLDFRLRDGTFLVSDLKINAPFLAGASLKLGGWGHTGRFDDLRYNSAGGLLAINGDAPKVHYGDYGFYGVVDAPVPGADNLSFFLRAIVAPARVNLVSRQIDAGLVRKGVFADKETDALGLAVSYAGISDAARGFDADAIAAGTGRVRRDFETVVEANYSIQVAAGWMLQPNIQYVFHPGGGAADPSGLRRLADATVVTFRSQWKF